MSVPFSSDEFLLKRSLFGSIFGVANRLKQAKTAANLPTVAAEQQQQQYFDESRQPCSSCQIFVQQRANDQLYAGNGSSSAPISHNTSARSPTTLLGQQFSDQLNFAAAGGGEGVQAVVTDDDDNNVDTNNSNNDDNMINDQRQKDDNGSDKASNALISREQIYAEIVRECSKFEQQLTREVNSSEQYQQQQEEEDDGQKRVMMELLVRSKDAEFVPSGGSLPRSDQLITGNDVGFSLDLERLIKVVVAHVFKEINANKRSLGAAEGVLPSLPRKQKRLAQNTRHQHCDDVTTAVVHGENAVQILERKREQNNAAAARYRQRQKEQKELLAKELCHLERTNGQLKADIGTARREIERAKAELWRRWHN